MPYATALCLIKGAHIEPVHQSALAYIGRTAYDESYSGVAVTYEEGLRVAGILGDCHTIMLRNHGPLVVGATAAEAFVRLNFLEEHCRWQILAMQTGRELQPVAPAVVAQVSARADADYGGYAAKQLAAMKRVLDREEPDYRS
jgi:ribulose-5-phosphate 4-epimerase/fuculose-1-phosphate aldolase